jgi:hypothetical protein
VFRPQFHFKTITHEGFRLAIHARTLRYNVRPGSDRNRPSRDDRFTTGSPPPNAVSVKFSCRFELNGRFVLASARDRLTGPLISSPPLSELSAGTCWR